MSIDETHSADFRDPQFWEKFYDTRGAPFEWYSEYELVGPYLRKYLNVNDRILQLGCGNSLLASQLYDDGYKCINSVDVDEGVILKQCAVNTNVRPELTFQCVSAEQINGDAESYNAIFDKGLIDALLPPNFSKIDSKKVKTIFQRISFLLAPGGRYVCVTLAQSHIVRIFVEYFTKSKRCFIVRAHQICEDSKCSKPVYLLVATKLRMDLPEPRIESVQGIGAKPKGVKDMDTLLEMLQSAQEFQSFCALCSKPLGKEQPSIVLCNSAGKPRFSVTIVERPRLEAVAADAFGAFIVPLGSESRDIYSTKEGRLELLQQCEKDRLAVVTLFEDGGPYGTFSELRDELSHVIKNFGESRVIEFLTTSDEPFPKEIVGSGLSEINGEYVVQDLQSDELKDSDTYIRQLIFTGAPYLVQSEALITKKEGVVEVLYDKLQCQYQKGMLNAFAFIRQTEDQSSSVRLPNLKLRVAVLGLGGGLLTSFILKFFPRCRVYAVDIDEEMATVAKTYFGLPSDNEHLHVKIRDALVFLKDIVTGGEKSLMDIIFVDIGGSSETEIVRCPTAEFRTDRAIAMMFNALKPNGILAVNLVTRSTEASNSTKAKFKKYFHQMFVHHTGEDVNQVLLCPKGSVTIDKALMTVKESAALDSRFQEFHNEIKLLKREKQ